MKDTASVKYAWLVTLIGCLYLVAVTFLDIPEKNVRWVDTIIGFMLGTLVSTALTYMIGTSKSSDDKTKIMNGIDNQRIKEEVNNEE